MQVFLVILLPLVAAAAVVLQLRQLLGGLMGLRVVLVGALVFMGWVQQQ